MTPAKLGGPPRARLKLLFQLYAIAAKAKSVTVRKGLRHRARRCPMFFIHAKGCSTTARTFAQTRVPKIRLGHQSLFAERLDKPWSADLTIVPPSGALAAC